jgi:predicted RecA/RadA family phage recombinase
MKSPAALALVVFGVAVADAAHGEPVRLKTTGVFDLVKLPAQAWAVGAKIDCDNTNKRCTSVATDNTMIGVTVAGAANPVPDGACASQRFVLIRSPRRLTPRCEWPTPC